jgi:methyl coenzyme M reductase subunit C
LPSGGGAAWAISIGAVCACDAGLANCIAVRAVVASSTRRSLVMMVGSPGKALATKEFCRPNVSARRSTAKH